MVVVYEVNIAAEKDIVEKYETWLKKHIKDMLKFEGFLSAELFTRKPEDEGLDKQDERKLFTMQYRLKDRKALDNYLTNHAPTMRQEGIQLFGNKFSATRRILSSELIETS